MVSLVNNPPVTAVFVGPDTQTSATYAGPPPQGPPPIAAAAARDAHMTNLLDEAKTVVASAASERANGASEEKGGPMQQIMELLKELKMEKLMDQIIGLIEKMESGKPGERPSSGITAAGPGIGEAPSSGITAVGPNNSEAKFVGEPVTDGKVNTEAKMNAEARMNAAKNFEAKFVGEPPSGGKVNTEAKMNAANNFEAKFVGEPVTDASMNFQVAGPPPGPQGMMAKLEMLLNQLTSLMGTDKADGPADSNVTKYEGPPPLNDPGGRSYQVDSADSGFAEYKDSGFIGMGQAVAAGVTDTAPADSGFVDMGQVVAAGVTDTAPTDPPPYDPEHLKDTMRDIDIGE